MTWSIYITVLLLSLPGMLGTYLASRHVSPSVRNERWRKLIWYVGIVTVMLTVLQSGQAIRAAAATGIAIVCWLEWQRASIWLTARLRWVGAGLLLVSLLIFVSRLYRLPGERLITIFLMVVMFDAFSQVSGQLIGRHKLMPRISPAKTVEGLVGGVLVTGLAAWWWYDAALLMPPMAYARLVASAVLGAWLGDTVASWWKRRCGIKDYSTLLPGQGGMLDRFDSFIGAVGVEWLSCALLS